MIEKVSIDEFLAQLKLPSIPLIDVRSPREYLHAHIPGATNIPLFNDEERAIIGTIYKQESKLAAIKEGLQTVGPRMLRFIEKIEETTAGKEICVHCWRGGMRSNSLAWLWNTAGYEVKILKGGYKAYRQKVMLDFKLPWDFVVLGGRTGSGKTDILHQLRLRGEQVIDLEGLANHKGSVFGGIGQGDQPSSEYFANLLHDNLSQLDIHKPIWLEDESSHIGNVHIPESFWRIMQNAPVIMVDADIKTRKERLIREYAHLDRHEIKEALSRIAKRLGNQNYHLAHQWFDNGKFEEVVDICLTYYDKSYDKCISRKAERNFYRLPIDRMAAPEAASKLQDFLYSRMLTQFS